MKNTSQTWDFLFWTIWAKFLINKEHDKTSEINHINLDAIGLPVDESIIKDLFY